MLFSVAFQLVFWFDPNARSSLRFSICYVWMLSQVLVLSFSHLEISFLSLDIFWRRYTIGFITEKEEEETWDKMGKPKTWFLMRAAVECDSANYRSFLPTWILKIDTGFDSSNVRAFAKLAINDWLARPHQRFQKKLNHLVKSREIFSNLKDFLGSATIIMPNFPYPSATMLGLHLGCSYTP